MCAPVAALGAVVGIVGAVANFQAKEQDYQAKAAAWRQNVVNAQAAARNDQGQLLQRQLQEEDKTTQDKHVSYIEGAQKAALAEASAAKGGVAGISVDNIVNDIQGKSALNRTYADINYMYKAADIQNRLTGTVITLQSRIDSIPRPVAPSPLELVAGIGGSLVKGFGGAGETLFGGA
jgi:hypothetical protein